MTRYAKGTTVTSAKTREEIERTLARYGADQFLYAWRDGDAVIGFRMNGRQIKFVLPLPSKSDPEFTQYMNGSVPYLRTESEAEKRYEQATRQRWRALGLIIKAKLEAIESGISIFEDEFMANVVLPDGLTVGEWMRPQIEEVYRLGKMPPMLPMLPAPTP